MKKRLTKIARDHDSTIGEIVSFLASYGFEAVEDPNYEVGSEELEAITFNFNAYKAEKNKTFIDSGVAKTSKEREDIDDLPLELKIIDAANREKKLIERIIGFTDFEWNFVIAKFQGECSQPVAFNLFDEVVCDILLIEETSLQSVGEVLGLDIKNDAAEREILSRAIKELRDYGMIDGDDSLLWLTEIGKDYARNGVKFSTFSRQFEIYFDTLSSKLEHAKRIFNRSKIEKSKRTDVLISTDLDTIKRFAEIQAPDIHFPDKGYILQSASLLSAEDYKAKVWVVFLENFKDNSMRTIVFDEKQNQIVDELSTVFNSLDSVKAGLLDKLTKVDENLTVTDEPKTSEQLNLENELIDKQLEIDEAIAGNHPERVTEIVKGIGLIKRHFNSLEFEVELKRLFDETLCDLWIISPWISYATYQRLPFFERYLKKGGKIFVAYSEPERDGDVMAKPDPLNKLLDLERKYTNFYIHQLPPFHYKNVWVRGDTVEHQYYTGSYNILSFFVMQGLQKYRQEKMTRLDWNEEIELEFSEVFKAFGLHYTNKAIADLNGICTKHPDKIDRKFLNKLSNFEVSKLKVFLKSGASEIDRAYEKLDETKFENLKVFRREYFRDKLLAYKERIEHAGKRLLSREEKAVLANDFARLRDEFLDITDVQMDLGLKLADEIDQLVTRNIHNGNRGKLVDRKR